MANRALFKANWNLFRAARRGNLDDARNALDQGAEINVRLLSRAARAFGEDCTPLHQAAAAGHQKMVELLLDEGAKIDRGNERGETALFLAAHTRCKEVVELLLDRGAYINDMTTLGLAPLNGAVIGGYKEVVELLLDRGAKVDGKERTEETPLHTAALKGQKDVVELLINRGAEIDRKRYRGPTSLGIAASYGHKGVAELLLSKSANIDEKDTEGWTPFHHAVFKSHPEVVKVLLEKGALSSRRINSGKVARDLTSNNEILDLLQNPPAVEKQGVGEQQRRARKDPPSESCQDRQAVCKGFEAHIAYYLPGYVQRQSFSVHNLIYSQTDMRARLRTVENKAREKAMANAKERVKELAREVEASDNASTALSESHRIGEALQEPWRWIHLPANNKRWVEDLVETLCFLGEIPVEECAAIQDFIKRSYEERKGSFLHQFSDAAESGGNNISFTIPYIDMEAEDYLDRENQLQIPERGHFKHMNALEVQYASDIHESRTLDRSHYETLENTHNRDKDQVVYRYTKRKRDKEARSRIGGVGLDSVNQDPKDGGQQGHNSSGAGVGTESGMARKSMDGIKEDEGNQKDAPGFDQTGVKSEESVQRRTKLLMVNQLWLWQIDSRTIITAFPDRWHHGFEDTLLQWILEADLDPKFGPSFPPMSGLDGLIAHIIRQCVRSIETPYNCGLDEPCFDIFEHSIANVSVLETECYNEFLDAKRLTESQAEIGPPESEEERTDKQTKYEKAINKVTDEAEHLREIKDIRDEINMIKRVLVVQEDIVKKWFHWWQHEESESMKHDKRYKQKYFRDLDFDMGLVSRLKRVKELDEDAWRLENSLNHLLDLKQKQSNLDEARSSRRLADAADQRALEAARQGMLLTVFTLVTVIFAPLSFMVALFALRVREFPQDDRGLIWTSAGITWRMLVGEASTGIGLIMIWMILPDSSIRLRASSIKRQAQLIIGQKWTKEHRSPQPKQLLKSRENQHSPNTGPTGLTSQALGAVKGYFASKARRVSQTGPENV